MANKLFVLVALFVVFLMEGCYVMTLPGVQRAVVGTAADQLDQAFGLGRYKTQPMSLAPTSPAYSPPTSSISTPTLSPLSQAVPPPSRQQATAASQCNDVLNKMFYRGCWQK